MYVGEEQKRYQVPLNYLSIPTQRSMVKSLPPYDLETKIEGPILLSCTPQFFDQFLDIAKEQV